MLGVIGSQFVARHNVMPRLVLAEDSPHPHVGVPSATLAAGSRRDGLHCDPEAAVVGLDDHERSLRRTSLLTKTIASRAAAVLPGHRRMGSDFASALEQLRDERTLTLGHRCPLP